MKGYKSLVIIPTYNEVENIFEIISQTLALSCSVDILVVDDNSCDGTQKIVDDIISSQKEERVHILKREKKDGLGRAYVAGFKWGVKRKYDFLFEMDADFSHNPVYLPHFLEEVQNNGIDLCIGSRYLNGKISIVNWPLSRVLMSYFASKYVSIVLRLNIFDATSGFKCFRREVLETIDLDKMKFKGYAFQVELHYKTKKLGFSIKEIPIIFTDRIKGKSKMSIRIFTEAFIGVLKLRFTKVRRKK